MRVVTMVLKSMRCWISPFYSSSCEQTKGGVLPVLWVGFAGFSFVLFLGVAAAQFAKGFLAFSVSSGFHVRLCATQTLTCLPAI